VKKKKKMIEVQPGGSEKLKKMEGRKVAKTGGLTMKGNQGICARANRTMSQGGDGSQPTRPEIRHSTSYK